MNIPNLVISEDGEEYVVKRENQYYRLGKNEGLVLKELQSGGTKESLSNKFGVSLLELEKFLVHLEESGIIGEKKKEKKNYLFYKIRLFNPDGVFEKIVNFIVKNVFLCRLLAVMIGAVTLIGLILLSLNFGNVIANTKQSVGTKEVITLYGATIFTILFHEFGHGLVCKYFGGEVNELGLLFVCGSPALYCDVSGIRTFSEKKKSIITLLAGVSVQLIIVAFTTIWIVINGIDKMPLLNIYIVWNLFMIVSNLLPITKLDGYWILSTIIKIPNLYEKSLKLALGKKENVLFNTYEQKRSLFIRLYGTINLSIMAFIIFTLVVNLTRIDFSSTNLLSTIFMCGQTIMGIALFFYFIGMLIKLKRSKGART